MMDHGRATYVKFFVSTKFWKLDKGIFVIRGGGNLCCICLWRKWWESHVGGNWRGDRIDLRAHPLFYTLRSYQQSWYRKLKERNKALKGSKRKRERKKRKEKGINMVSREHKRAVLHEKLQLLRSITNSHAVIPSTC